MSQMGEIGSIQDAYRGVFWQKKKYKKSLVDELAWRASMFRSYFTITLRSLIKHRMYAGINIVGLSIGLSAFLLIGLFVRYELSYDRFHEDVDRIYRVIKEDPGNFYLDKNEFAVTPVPLPAALEMEIPGVERATQITNLSSLLTAGENSFYEDGIYATDSFFDVFTFPLLSGSDSLALIEPNSIVLTQSLALRLFSRDDVVGEMVHFTYFSEALDLHVTGVTAHPPKNSHFSFEYIISMTTDRSWVRNPDHWDNNSWYTYFRATPTANPEHLDTSIREMAVSKLSKMDWFKANPERMTRYFIQPLSAVHLYSHANFEIGYNGDIKFVYIFSAIALFILLIACVNYTNLATARSASRAREIGVRQVSGAKRSQLIQQFLGESLLITTIATALSMFTVWAVLPAFSTLVGRDLPSSLIFEGKSIAVVLVTAAVVGLISGSYPALVLSGLKPSRVLNGVRRMGSARSFLRNALVVTQYSIGIVLIVGTLVVENQLDFLSAAETGFSREQIITVRTRDPELRDRYSSIYAKLATIPSVSEVSGSQSLPTRITPQSSTKKFEGNDEDRLFRAYGTYVGYDWVEMLGLELIEGRSFSRDIPGDEGVGLIINEAARKLAGWDFAVGKTLEYSNRGTEVIGVVKDFHFHSFRQQIEPLVLNLSPERANYILIKIEPADVGAVLGKIKGVMAEFSPEYPFEYKFLDEAYNNMYQSDQKFGEIFRYFAIIAMAIACMGLFALSAFLAEQRKNEIGIRKALGAGSLDIVLQLSRDFLSLIVIALVIGGPVAWFVMNTWLEDFAYRVEFGWPTILYSGFITITVAWGTVAYQSIRASRLNPVEALKCE